MAENNFDSGGLENGVEKRRGGGQAERQGRVPRSRIASAIEGFSPLWFGISMNTGVLSIILHQIPDPYHGQWMDICSTILFVFNLIIFFTFILITILRIIIYPSATRQQSANAEESAFWACLPIAAFTIVAQIALTVSTANWNGTGHAFMLLAYVLWWVVVVWTLATGGVVLVFLVKHPATKDEVLPTSVFIPGVSLATAAVVGSNIVSYGYGVSPQLAVPVIIVGYLILGFGANLALGLYSLFLNKLFATGWPPPEKIPSLILLVGPFGQSAAAVIFLGASAQKFFGGYDSGTFLTMSGGMGASGASVVLGLLFLGFDVLWMILSLYAILEAAFNRQLSFNLTWWSTIFPMATVNLAFIALSEALGSYAFGVLAVIWMVALFIDYFVCWGFTLVWIARGKLLDGRSEEQKKD